MKFIVRVDDVGWTNHVGRAYPEKADDAGLRCAKAFHQAMGGVPWLAAVIPSGLDPEAVAWIRSGVPGVTWAVHGWAHNLFAGSEESEFWNASKEECDRRLRASLEKLGVQVRHFVPPFNAVPPQLLEALPGAGLKVLWDAPMPDFPCPRRRRGVIEIPAEESLYGATDAKAGPIMREVNSVIEEVIDRPGVAVITLHLPWELAASQPLEGVAKMAALIRDNALSPDDYVSDPDFWA